MIFNKILYNELNNFYISVLKTIAAFEVSARNHFTLR